ARDRDRGVGAPLDDPEGAAADAVPAPVADVVLEDDGAEHAAEEGPRRAGVETAGVGAVLAHVGGHQPPEVRHRPDHGGAGLVVALLPEHVAQGRPVVLDRGGQAAVSGRRPSDGVDRTRRGRGTDRGHAEVDECLTGLAGRRDPVLALLDEGDVAPGARTEVAGVVVGVRRQPEVVHRQRVPLLARDLAGLAADADRGVGEETLARWWVDPSGVPGGVAPARELAGQITHGVPPSSWPPAGSERRWLPVSTVVPARDWYSATSRSSSSPRGRRPGRMSQEPTLDSWIWTLGSRAR